MSDERRFETFKPPLRVRALLDSYGVIILIVLIIATVMTGFWVYQVHFVTEFDQETEEEVIWSESTDYTHSSIIVNDTLPFEVGERVENRPIYYTLISESIDVDFQYTYDADDGTLDVNTETALRFHAVEGDDILWEYVEPLASESTPEMTPGSLHNETAAVNFDTIFTTVATIQEQLGAPGTIEISVVTVMSVNGEVAGETVDEQHESLLRFEVTDNTFRVAESSTIDEQHTTFEVEEIEVEPSFTDQILSLVSFLISFAALIGFIGARQVDLFIITDEEIQLLDLRQQEQEFDDWITTGTFPAERDYERTILVESLEGLVDVAIDSNRRVIKDEQLGVATVLDDTNVYIYVWPNSPASDWLVNYADMEMEEFERLDF